MSAAPRAIVITAADDQYRSLAQDLVSSLQACAFRAPVAIGMLDVGLSEAARAAFAGQGVTVVPVQSDIDFPAREQWERAKPGIRTLTARPFLRRYFPGYDIYIWVDADIWAQTPEAIDHMITSAATHPGIHIACEWDRDYKLFFQSAAMWQIFHGWYKTGYGDAVAGAMSLRPMLNAGVFAMNAASPVWDAWRDIYAEVLQGSAALTPESFMADQLGLNILLYLKGLPHVVMPATFNWMTFHALPMLDPDTGLYVEPSPPHRPLSMIHLTRPIKEQPERIALCGGGTLERPLTFGARVGETTARSAG